MKLFTPARKLCCDGITFLMVTQSWVQTFTANRAKIEMKTYIFGRHLYDNILMTLM